MHVFLCTVFLGLVTLPPDAQAQSADDVTKLISRLIELDSIDLAKDVRFRASLEPSLHALHADESTSQSKGDAAHSTMIGNGPRPLCSPRPFVLPETRHPRPPLRAANPNEIFLVAGIGPG